MVRMHFSVIECGKKGTGFGASPSCQVFSRIGVTE
jgi:hypothetical protein